MAIYRAGIVGLGWMGWLYNVATRTPKPPAGMPPLREDRDAPPIWHLSADARLSIDAQTIFQQADTGAVEIYIPSIVLVEAVYLAEKKRIDEVLIEETLTLFTRFDYPYRLAVLDVETVQALRVINRSDIPDMPDRIIVATAYQLGLPLISRDKRIANAGFVTQEFGKDRQCARVDFSSVEI